MSLVVPFEEIFANRNGLLAKHDSWERVELGRVCTILNGFPFKSSLFNKSQGFPVIRPPSSPEPSPANSSPRTPTMSPQKCCWREFETQKKRSGTDAKLRSSRNLQFAKPTQKDE